MKNEEIRNMKIEPGIHQWDGEEDGMTCGSVEIVLPNGTTIEVVSVKHGNENYSCTINIHNLNDTQITIFNKVKKSIRRIKEVIWTKISRVEA